MRELERHREEDLRRDAQDTKKLELLVKRKQFEQVLGKIDHPNHGADDWAITPKDLLKFLMMVKDCDPRILRSTTQKITEYAFLHQFKGLQLFEAAFSLAKINPPPQEVDPKDLAALMTEMYGVGEDAGISKGRKVAYHEVLLLLAELKQARVSSQSTTAGPTATSEPSKVAPSSIVGMSLSPVRGVVNAGGSISTMATLSGLVPTKFWVKGAPDMAKATREFSTGIVSPTNNQSTIVLHMAPGAKSGDYELTFIVSDDDGRTAQAGYMLTVV